MAIDTDELKQQVRLSLVADRSAKHLSDPWAAAHYFLSKFYAADSGMRRIQFWQGQFLEWCDGAYRELTLADLRSKLYEFFAEGGKPPRKKLIDDVIDALRAAANLSDRVNPPTWLYAGDSADPILRDVASSMIPFRNGLLNVDTREFHTASPGFFSLYALPFLYDPKASPPARWIASLQDWFGDDQESILLLQQWFGYCLLPRTDMQKALMVIGPPRGGKGTIARVLQALVGRANTCSPTLSSMGTQFGLQPLIGKLLAIISDARLGGRADIHSVAENILRVTGEDQVSIQRKFLADYTATLQARIMVLSNEAPRFSDASAALIRRFMVLQVGRSFLGKEDIGLTAALLRELPSIFLWAIDGLDSLKEAGRFMQPETGTEAIADMDAMASPVKIFIEETCDMDPAAEIPCGRLFEAWQSWCTKSGRQHAGNLQVFGRDLRAALPGLRTVSRRDMAGGRERAYIGIRLSE